MCTPIALGLVGIAGGALQGIGDYSAHMNNATSYTLQAKGLDRDIAAEKQSSAYEVARTRETVAKTLGNARAGMAANGLALSGTVATVLNDSAIEGDLDVAAIRWNSDQKVASLGYARGTAKLNAKQEKAAAPIAFLSGLAGGVAKFGGQFG